MDKEERRRKNRKKTREVLVCLLGKNFVTRPHSFFQPNYPLKAPPPNLTLVIGLQHTDFTWAQGNWQLVLMVKIKGEIWEIVPEFSTKLIRVHKPGWDCTSKRPQTSTLVLKKGLSWSPCVGESVVISNHDFMEGDWAEKGGVLKALSDVTTPHVVNISTKLVFLDSQECSPLLFLHFYN